MSFPTTPARASFMRSSLRVASKEVKESLYAVRGSMWAVIAAIVLSLMSYLLLTDRELSLLDQSEMLYIIASLTVGLGLLVAGILAGDAIVGERERMTLESLLLTPIRLGALVMGKVWAILAAWLLIFAIAAPYILVVGAGTSVSAPALVYTFVLGTICVAGFAALIVGASALARSGRGVTLGAVAVLIAMAAPTLLGTALQKSWFGNLYNVISPFAQVRISLDSVIVDREILLLQLPHIGALVAFAAIAGALAALAARGISLEGGE
jgi:ABC-type transport system involved in multi-copper enzyme maturation permease subunit